MIIGCVKEIKNNEFRVGLTPDNVYAYVQEGHTVYVQNSAGEGSGFSDEEYREAGAILKEDAREIWDLAEMMVKVKEPLEEEYPLFHDGLILYTYLHLAADRQQTDALLAHKVKMLQDALVDGACAQAAAHQAQQPERGLPHPGPVQACPALVHRHDGEERDAHAKAVGPQKPDHSSPLYTIRLNCLSSSVFVRRTLTGRPWGQ